MVFPFAGAAAKDLHGFAGTTIGKECHGPDLLDPDAMIARIVRGRMDVNIENDGILIMPS